MKTVLRPRYYCEYCKKSGGRKDIIAKHETGCTANPHRVCGCCRLAAMKQPSIDELRNALNEDAKEFGEYSPHDDGDSVGKFVRERVSTNCVENFFSLLKRALKGTYIHVSSWHLFRYAGEQGFRYNVRKLSDAARFLNLLRGVVGKRITYKQLAAIGDAGFMGIK